MTIIIATSSATDQTIPSKCLFKRTCLFRKPDVRIPFNDAIKTSCMRIRPTGAANTNENWFSRAFYYAYRWSSTYSRPLYRVRCNFSTNCGRLPSVRFIIRSAFNNNIVIASIITMITARRGVCYFCPIMPFARSVLFQRAPTNPTVTEFTA